MKKLLISILLLVLPISSFSVERKEFEIFYLALTIGDNSIELRKLAEKGIDINQQRPHDGLSPLHLAARAGGLEDLKTLIELGADVNIQDIEGHSPLDFAIYRRPEHAETLVKAGGQRFKLWRVTTLFGRRSNVFNIVSSLGRRFNALSVVFLLGVFIIAAALFKIAQKRYDASILAFGIVGISYFSFIILPQITYSGYNSLPYIKVSELVFSIFPIAVCSAYIIAGGKSTFVERVTKYTVVLYIVLSSWAALVLIPVFIIGLGIS